MELSFGQLRKITPQLIASGISVELIGPSGCGKTEFCKQMNDHMASLTGRPRGFAMLNCSTALPVTVPGLPFLSKTDTGIYKSINTQPVWKTCVDGTSADDYEEGMLVLDERRSAEGDIKKQLADLQLNKAVGQHRLKPGWSVWSTGNRTQDRSGVTKDYDFIINRQCQVHIRQDINDIADNWAERGVHPIMIAWAESDPTTVIHEAVPEKQGPWCTARSAVMADRLLKQFVDPAEPDKIPMNPVIQGVIAGMIGTGAALQLATFLKMANSNIQWKDVLADPINCRLPERPDMMMLTGYMLASKVDTKTIDPCVKYMKRLPQEFATMFMRGALKRDPNVINSKALGDWLAQNATLMNVVMSMK
jgi:hypothetical protein